MINRLRVMISGMTALACRLAFIFAVGLLGYAAVITGMRFPWLGLILLVSMAWRWIHRGGVSDAYGSARTASTREVGRAGLFSDHGVILGRFVADRPSPLAAIGGLFTPSVRSDIACRTFLAMLLGRGWLEGRMLRTSTYVHLATFSPPGGGKGVGVMIPNLLSYRGNCVIVDPKGENFKATADHRRKKFGHRIIRLDPFGVCGPGSDTLNPLDPSSSIRRRMIFWTRSATWPIKSSSARMTTRTLSGMIPPNKL